jgi:hypothetical protein
VVSLYRKLTTPVGVPLLEVTVAVRVTVSPIYAGLGEAVKFVVVLTAVSGLGPASAWLGRGMPTVSRHPATTSIRGILTAGYIFTLQKTNWNTRLAQETWKRFQAYKEDVSQMPVFYNPHCGDEPWLRGLGAQFIRGTICD